jgi:hypothetical protein
VGGTECAREGKAVQAVCGCGTEDGEDTVGEVNKLFNMGETLRKNWSKTVKLYGKLRKTFKNFTENRAFSGKTLRKPH